MPMKLFIDGAEGTTGLQLEARLRARADAELLVIDPARRKDPDARRALMAQADAVFLCLPDEAARESARLFEGLPGLLIDASTAHRTAPGWVYGFPELSAGHRAAVQNARRVANPGCHATGFAALVYPLVAGGLLPPETPLCCTSLTGYSGGGKSMIARYETGRTQTDPLHAPRPYALGLTHKHLPEMQTVCGLTAPPHFLPVVGDVAQGMAVSVPLFSAALKGNPTARDVWEILREHYAGARFVKVLPFGGEGVLDAGALDMTAINGTNDLEILVFGHETQILLISRLDNLGKGASGAAVQNLNIAMGLPEDTGL